MEYESTVVFHVDEEIANVAENTFVISSVTYQNGLVIGYNDGTIDVYSHDETNFELVSTIKRHYDDSLLESRLVALHLIEDTLLIALYDNFIAKYLLPTGTLIAFNQLSLIPQGIATSPVDDGMNFFIYIWGRSCEIVLLDGLTLQTIKCIRSLSDWPIATSFSTDKILLAYVGSGRTSTMSLNPEKGFELAPFVAFEEPPLHDVIIALRRISANIFLVLFRNGWSFFKLHQSEELTKFSLEFSSGTTSSFISLIASTMPDESKHSLVQAHDSDDENEEISHFSFGALSYDGTVTWVSNGTIQLLEPIWDPTSAVTISYDSVNKSLIAIIQTNNSLHSYLADTTHHSLEWSYSSCLSKFNIVPTDYKLQLTHHDSNIILTKGNILEIYTLQEFLKRSTDKTVSLDSNSSITTVLGTDDNIPNIFIGSSNGRLFIIDKETAIIKANKNVFATAFRQILKIPDYDLLLAISASSTVAIINSTTGQVLVQIPGHGIAIEKLTIQESNLDSDSESAHSPLTPATIQIFYKNSKRAWNLHTLEELYMYPRSPSSASLPSFLGKFEEPLEYIQLLPKQESTANQHHIPRLPNNVLFLDLDAILDKYSITPYKRAETSLIQLIAQSLISIDGKHAKNDWQRLLTRNTSTKLGIADKHSFWSINPSLSTISKLNRSQSLKLICLWVAFARLFFLISGQYQVSYKELLDWLYLMLPPIDIDDITNLIINSSGQLQISAVCCLEVIISRENSNDIIKYWEPNLPSLSQDVFQMKGIKSIIILTSLAKCLKSIDNASFVKEIGESLQLALIGGSPNIIRDTAILLIGNGWKILQQNINPFNILDALVTILCNHGFVNDKSERETQLTSLCRRCIEQIAVQNITLLISTLSVQITDSTKSIDSRVTSVRLLSILISSPFVSIEPSHLPTIVSAAVKLLEASDPSTKWLSSGGTSLVTESIRFLSNVMISYPNYVAFHKQQQRFAVCATPEGVQSESSSTNIKYLSMVGYIYDLRNGYLIESIGNNKLSDTYLVNIKFSPDGKHLGGILVSTMTVKYLIGIWKIDSGLLNIKFPTFSLTRHDDTSEKTATGSGNLIQPRLLEEISFKFDSDLCLEWTDDSTIVVSSQFEDQTVEEPHSFVK